MKPRIQNILLLALGLIIVTLSNIQGIMVPPVSITVTPILLPFIVGLVFYPVFKRSFIWAMIFSFVLIVFNDLFIRLSIRADEDTESGNWIALFSLIAIGVSTIIMIIYAFIFSRAGEGQTRRRAALRKVFIVLGLALITYIICTILMLVLPLRAV